MANTSVSKSTCPDNTSVARLDHSRLPKELQKELQQMRDRVRDRFRNEQGNLPSRPEIEAQIERDIKALGKGVERMDWTEEEKLFFLNDHRDVYCRLAFGSDNAAVKRRK